MKKNEDRGNGANYYFWINHSAPVRSTTCKNKSMFNKQQDAEFLSG